MKHIVILTAIICASTLFAVQQSNNPTIEQSNNSPTADRGGLTFDFRAISARRFATEGAQNLDPAGWRGGYNYIHDAHVATDDPRREAIKRAIAYTRSGDEWTVLKKPELVSLAGGEDIAVNVSGGMRYDVKLPNADGGVYHIAVSYRMRNDLGSGSVLLTPFLSREGLAKGINAPGDTSKLLSVNRLSSIWSDWLLWAKDYRVPRGCDTINIVMRIDGVGELKFREASVTPVTVENEITLVSSPAGFFDGTFAVSEGQCALPVWLWKKNDPDRKYAADRFTFVLTLPKGYRFLESTAGLVGRETARTLPDGSTEYRIPSDGKYAGCHIEAEYHSWPVLAALIRAETGADAGEMRFYAEYGGRRVSDIAVTRLFTIPPIRAKVPKVYANGFYPGGSYAAFATDAARAGFADMFTAAGATWVAQMKPDDETLKLWRAKGVRYVTPEHSGLCSNGFQIGHPKNAPPEDRYVRSNRKTHRTVNPAVCPISVYGESDYFRTNTLPALKDFLKGCDGMWANWEPYSYTGQGCMCDKCRTAFARHVGVTDAEMAKDWPDELAYGHKWYDKVVRFRSLEHAKLVKTLARHIAEYSGGGDAPGFIPAVAWTEMSSMWRPKNIAAEVQPYDYAGSLKWIDPWGPYPWWDATTPYAKGDGTLLEYFTVAKDVRAQVDKDYGKRAPMIMALPHGVQLRTCYTQPESIAISLDSFFFNRWNSSVLYHFPKGYDARYWQAFAEATTRAAEYEDYVLDGRRCDDEVTVTPGNDPLLRHVAYERNGRTIVAVFNFSDATVARATITVKGVTRPVTVGATRCRVFTFRSPDEKTLGIIGIDTSHVVEFSKIFNGANPAPEFAGYHVGKVYRWGSRDIASCTNRHEKYTATLATLGVAVTENMQEVIDESDYILLETNDGRERYRQSVEVFKSGKRAFLDKPLAHDLPDVIRILDAAERYHASFFSSSTTRFDANVKAARSGCYGPIRACDTVTNTTREEHHSRYYWYAMHGVESLIAVMGPDVVKVQAIANETEDILVGTWRDGRIGTVRALDYAKPGGCLGGTIYPAKGPRILFGGAWQGYGVLLNPILRYFESGAAPVDPRETLAVYAFCTAAEQSVRMGGVAVSIADVIAAARAEAAQRTETEAK